MPVLMSVIAKNRCRVIRNSRERRVWFVHSGNDGGEHSDLDDDAVPDRMQCAIFRGGRGGPIDLDQARHQRADASPACFADGLSSGGEERD